MIHAETYSQEHSQEQAARNHAAGTLASMESTAGQPPARIMDLIRARLEAPDSQTHAAIEAELMALLDEKIRRLVGASLQKRRLHLGYDDEQDLVQEVLIEVWSVDLDRFDPEQGHIMAFLATRVHWRVGDLMRRLCSKAARHEEVSPKLEDLVPQDPEAVRERADRELRLMAVRPMTERTLHRMTHDPAARRIVRDHDLGGEPLCRLAKQMRIHPSNVTRARQRGLAWLRRQLEPTLMAA